MNFGIQGVKNKLIIIGVHAYRFIVLIFYYFGGYAYMRLSAVIW